MESSSRRRPFTATLQVGLPLLRVSKRGSALKNRKRFLPHGIGPMASGSPSERGNSPFRLSGPPKNSTTLFPPSGKGISFFGRSHLPPGLGSSCKRGEVPFFEGPLSFCTRIELFSLRMSDLRNKAFRSDSRRRYEAFFSRLLFFFLWRVRLAPSDEDSPSPKSFVSVLATGNQRTPFFSSHPFFATREPSPSTGPSPSPLRFLTLNRAADLSGKSRERPCSTEEALSKDSSSP